LLYKELAWSFDTSGWGMRISWGDLSDKLHGRGIFSTLIWVLVRRDSMYEAKLAMMRNWMERIISVAMQSARTLGGSIAVVEWVK
jgi:hypothetical protein